MKALCVLFLALTCGSMALTATKTLEVSATKVSFIATGKPGLLKIKGEAVDALRGDVTLDEKGASGNFSFELASLKTGISLRDEHMKEKYLEVGKHPRAILKFMISATPAQLEKDLKGDVDGELTLHGVTRKINLNYSYEPVANRVSADFNFKISDFGIQVPSYLGVTVSESVAVTVGLTAIRK